MAKEYRNMSDYADDKKVRATMDKNFIKNHAKSAALKKKMAGKMSYHQKMEKKGYHYVAPEAPETAFHRRNEQEQKEHEEYYRIHKGTYVKNKIGKNGKYV